MTTTNPKSDPKPAFEPVWEEQYPVAKHVPEDIDLYDILMDAMKYV